MTRLKRIKFDGHISKSGSKYIINIPKRYRDLAEKLHESHVPVRIIIEPLARVKETG